MRSVKRDELLAKNRQYLESLKKGRPDQDVRSEILGAVFDSLADAVLVFDKDKRVVLANEAAALQSGWDLESVSREQLHEQFQFFLNDRSDERLPVQDEPLEVAMREKRNAFCEAFVKSASMPNGEGWFRAHAAPILDEKGKVVGGASVFQDITEAVRAKFQRDCLTSLIAHDLKNHLAANDIMLKLVKGLLPGELSEKFQDIAYSVQESNDRYMRMCESLIELSRSQFLLDPSHAQRVDLSEALNNAIAATKLAAARKNVTVTLNMGDKPPFAMGLPATIYQVFINVVLNAIEVSDEGSDVEVKAFATDHGRARILVIDKGPGIPPERLNELFDPRRVASHEKRSSHSTGFGLYLTAMLVESQNGTVFCRSEVGKGTTFGIEFPAATA